MLNPRQIAFVTAYLADANGKEAAISAGYSPRGAAQAASRLLKHPAVKREIDSRMPTPAPASGSTVDPLEYMLSVVSDTTARGLRRDRMAIAAAKYLYPKGDIGQKGRAKVAATAAARGRFKPGDPPATILPFPRKPT